MSELQQDAAPVRRYFNMDGMRHEFGDCYCTRVNGRKCHSCSGALHKQGVWGGLMELCERCDIDKSTTNLAEAGEP